MVVPVAVAITPTILARSSLVSVVLSPMPEEVSSRTLP
jgi:hypothetical protein